MNWQNWCQKQQTANKLCEAERLLRLSVCVCADVCVCGGCDIGYCVFPVARSHRFFSSIAFS